MKPRDFFSGEARRLPARIRPVELIEELDLEKVADRDVEYLCFEGGGGKGVIYLGAIRELEERRILTYSNQRDRLDPNGQIKGIAGSSAGALTAVLLSCGYNGDYLERLVFGTLPPRTRPITSFNEFFDLPTPQMPKPTPTGCRNTRGAVSWRNLGVAASRLIPGNSGRLIRAGPTSGLALKLASYPAEYAFNFVQQWGVFSGCAAHDLFNRLIARQAARRAGNPGAASQFLNLNFAMHKRLFGCELVLTGSNFSTGKTGFFSAETTPNFPVAAAARISMGLPLIFKPMVISPSTAVRYAIRSSNPRNMPASEMKGVWVDGGYFNNLPQRAFSHRPNGLTQTLGFSLQDYGSQSRSITSLATFLLAYANHGLFGGGESQTSRSTGIADFVVPLVAGDAGFQIGTTQFAFTTDAEKDAVRRLVQAARQDTKRYFETP